MVYIFLLFNVPQLNRVFQLKGRFCLFQGGVRMFLVVRDHMLVSHSSLGAASLAASLGPVCVRAGTPPGLVPRNAGGWRGDPVT